MDFEPQQQRGGTGQTAPLIGRAHEMRVITGALRNAPRGRPSVIHLVGQAGLGKTRLISEACAEARRQNMLVITGCAEERSSARLFSAVVEPFVEHVATRSASVREQRIQDGGALTSLLRAQPPADVATPDTVGAHGIGALVRQTLTELGDRQPVLLALDDLHWADEASIDVLTNLSTRPPYAAVVLLLGYRPLPGLGGLQALRPGLVEGAVPHVLHKLALEPLGEDAVRELLPDAGSARRRELFRVCGGNPFFLQSLHHSSTEVLAEEGAAGALPYPVRAALLSELTGLDETTRRVADVAAVVGEPFGPGLVASVSQLPSPAVLEALDTLTARNVCDSDGMGRWRFRHPLLRRVAYEAQSSGSRFQTHRRAASVLAEAGAALPEQAPHVLMSAEPGDRTSAELLLDAADQLAEQAPTQAERWYAAALSVLASGGARGRLTVQLSRAIALASTGRLAEARTLVHDVLAELPRDDARRLPASGLAARVELLMGRNAESEALLLRELDAADRRNPEGLAALYLELATTRLMGGSFAAARDSADSAKSLIAADDHLLATYADAASCLGATTSGDFAVAYEMQRAAARGCDGLADAELARRLEAGVWLGWAEMFLELLPDSQRHLERCLGIARRGAHQHLLPHLLIGYGSVLLLSGELVRAAEAYDEAAEVAARLGGHELATMTMAMQCRAATWLGDLERAEAIGLRAVQEAADRDNWFAAVAAAVLAQARLAAGRVHGCVAAILLAGGGESLSHFDPASRCDWWEVATRAALLEGDGDAATFAQDALDVAASLPLSAPRGFAALAQAQVMAQRGLPARAHDLAKDAVRHFSESGFVLQVARAHFLDGVALSEMGRRSESLLSLGRAEAVFRESGAAHLQSQARGVMRRLGRRMPTTASERAAADAGATGPIALLSRREREVAALVALGRTNRQIAGELVLSEKTVESHLGHIFTKLGVTSRAAVAAMASQHDLASSESSSA